jgi:hypothetical protein
MGHPPETRILESVSNDLRIAKMKMEVAARWIDSEKIDSPREDPPAG